MVCIISHCDDGSDDGSDSMTDDAASHAYIASAGRTMPEFCAYLDILVPVYYICGTQMQQADFLVLYVPVEAPPTAVVANNPWTSSPAPLCQQKVCCTQTDWRYENDILYITMY